MRHGHCDCPRAPPPRQAGRQGVRPRSEFVAFRVQAFGGLERVAGQRANGSWDTATWLIAKDAAHVENGRLVADSAAARKLLQSLGSAPVQVRGDRFKAKPHRRIPASEKPTAAMRRAQLANIKKAQAAQRQRRGAGTGTKRRGKA